MRKLTILIGFMALLLGAAACTSDDASPTPTDNGGAPPAATEFSIAARDQDSFSLQARSPFPPAKASR